MEKQCLKSTAWKSIGSLNSYKDHVWWVTLPPFYRRENWYTRRWSNLPSHVIKTGAQQKLNFCNQNPVLLTILSLWGFVNWNYTWPSGCWHISSGLMEWEPIHNLSQKKKYFLHLNPWQLNPLAAPVGMMWEEKWHVCEYYIIFGSIKWIFILKDKVVAGILSGLAGCQGQLNFSTKPFGFIQAF